MTIKEKYNLEFQKKKGLSSDRIYYRCRCNIKIGDYHALTIIDLLNDVEILGLREDIDNALSGEKMFEGEDWVTQSIEDGYNIIHFEYPNITLREIFTLPMIEMLQLLDEWIAFCGYN